MPATTKTHPMSRLPPNDSESKSYLRLGKIKLRISKHKDELIADQCGVSERRGGDYERQDGQYKSHGRQCSRIQRTQTIEVLPAVAGSY